MNNSTADNFCRVLAKIQAIEPGNDEPMRHQMRAMKRVAYDLIDNALRQAEALAFAAADMRDDCAAAIEDARAKADSTASTTEAGGASQ